MGGVKPNRLDFWISNASREGPAIPTELKGVFDLLATLLTDPHDSLV